MTKITFLNNPPRSKPKIDYPLLSDGTWGYYDGEYYIIGSYDHSEGRYTVILVETGDIFYFDNDSIHKDFDIIDEVQINAKFHPKAY